MRILLVLAGFALLLTACSGASYTGLPTDSPRPTLIPTPALDVSSLDPCSLLSDAEVSEALAASLSGVATDGPSGYRACAYADAAASTTLTVLVATRPAPAGQGEDRAGQLPQDGRAEELHGVGEAAWFDYCPACPDDGSTTLTVIEPPLEFTLALLLPAPEMARRLSLEELARSAVDGMGL